MARYGAFQYCAAARSPEKIETEVERLHRRSPRRPVGHVEDTITWIESNGCLSVTVQRKFRVSFQRPLRE